ncbi:MAG: hypothetical protein HQL50_09505 [Magnetococcales bacterium]|nr:hypothetical protein [Magnetococcales bacterium]
MTTPEEAPDTSDHAIKLEEISPIQQLITRWLAGLICAAIGALLALLYGSMFLGGLLKGQLFTPSMLIGLFFVGLIAVFFLAIAWRVTLGIRQEPFTLVSLPLLSWLGAFVAIVAVITLIVVAVKGGVSDKDMGRVVGFAGAGVAMVVLSRRLKRLRKRRRKP